MYYSVGNYIYSERNFDLGEFEYSNIRRRIGDAYLKYSNIWHIRQTRIVLLGLAYSKFRSLYIYRQAYYSTCICICGY